MNALNSLILEGTVNEKPVRENRENVVVLKFPVNVKRYYKNADNENVEESYRFNVEAYNQMAEFTESKLLKPGRGIRVVGRLKEVKGNVFVVAEHIEFKPMKTN